jgi:cGMP-dependent protein kinase
MVENNGHLKLIDMGTAKKLTSNKGFRTFTMIGTPHYMAPEVMQGKGYSFAADIWSLGVILY